MKRTFLILTTILFGHFVYSQQVKQYPELITEAEHFYNNSEYTKAGDKYSEAFNTYGKQVKDFDRYNAACSWALANQADSAFSLLFRIKININQVSTDEDLITLHSDKRWVQLLQHFKQNEEKLDKLLVEKLALIFQEDQQYRKQVEDIEQQYGWNSKEMKEHWTLINEKDSINLIEITKILDEHGWLGEDVLGQEGNLTLFLVIQHADLKTQEKYLPLMRDAVNKGNANPENLALLEDRVALRQGNRQIYGSQIYRDKISGNPYVAPLDDPYHVDQRRAEVGLGKYQDYLTNFGLIWDAAAYSKELPTIEAKLKED